MSAARQPKPPREIWINEPSKVKLLDGRIVTVHAAWPIERYDSVRYVLADDATASPQPKRKRKAGKR